jgi:hydrophobic/amphiphilic exporter-1 (mainly G- bacteria), HAE1 family
MSAPDPQPLDDQATRIAGSLTEFSLRRPVTVLVLLMSILVVGVVAMLGIPLELVPRGFTSQSLAVFAPWHNAPTQEVLDKITLPLEEELSTVRGLSGMHSVSSLGNSRIFLNFKQGIDMDIAYREVRDRIQRARLHFPDDVDRVFIRKQDASGIPVCVIGIVIDPSLADHYTLIKREILQPLERIDGVANVTTDGLEEKEIIIELDRQKTEAHGLNIYHLAQQLGGDNFTMASGHVRDSGRKFMLRSIANYRSLEELENRPVSPTVRLRDIARVKFEEPEKRYSVRVNSRPAVAAVLFKEGEANTVDVSKRIRKAFEEMQGNPRLSSFYLDIIFNQGEVIQASLGNLVKGGLLGGALAALVLFLFLRRFRITGIITLAIPLSILIALTVMFFTGETLNILSILALVIAVGMLVDNSIVVAENIHRLHQEGLPRRQACVRGAAEIALAITMATFTTIIVFVPVALVEGEGQFFLMRLALPISVSLVASLFVALVFIPLSVYLTLPSTNSSNGQSRFSRGLGAFYDQTFGRLNHLYTRALAIFLRRRLDLVILLAALLVPTYYFAYRKLEIVDQQEEDRTSFQVGVELPNEYGFSEVADYFAAAEKVLEQHQDEYELKGYFVFYHRRGGRLEGWLKDDRKGTLTAKDIAEKIAKALPEKPGAKVRHGRENQAQDAKGRESYVFRIEGDDAGVLDEIAAQLESLLLPLDGILGLRRGDDPSPSEMALVVDRTRATASSVNPEVIAGLVGYALRGSSLPKFNYEGREVPVRIRFQESDRESLADLAGFNVPAEGGSVIPLSALAHSKVLSSPKRISRNNKRTSHTLTLELKKETAKETRQTLDAIKRQMALPEGVTFSTTQARTHEENVANMKFAAQLSVLFIYLLMGFLFESFVLPLSILLTIPLASMGVAWVHYLTGKDIDFLGLVGGILLIGVVVNNGIVLIDYVTRLRAAGMERNLALLTAAARRFRPIAMTALTTIIGMIPLTLAKPNEMGLSYKSFGLTLIGGMTTATILTLLVVPVFYTFFDDARNALLRVLRSMSPKHRL